MATMHCSHLGTYREARQAGSMLQRRRRAPRTAAGLRTGLRDMGRRMELLRSVSFMYCIKGERGTSAARYSRVQLVTAGGVLTRGQGMCNKATQAAGMPRSASSLRPHTPACRTSAVCASTAAGVAAGRGGRRT